ncbi:MAG: hypothetical protein ACK5MH_10005 [Bacteroidales bacterium]
MAIVIRNRTIRNSSRKSYSLYRIQTENISTNDSLVVNIDHESKSFQKTYTFSGKDIYPRKSIYFKVKEDETETKIVWSPKSFAKNIISL